MGTYNGAARSARMGLLAASAAVALDLGPCATPFQAQLIAAEWALAIFV